MNATAYKINEILTIRVESSQESIRKFFDTKCRDLFDGEQDADRLLEVDLVERDAIPVDNPMVLREITIPEIFTANDQVGCIVRDGKRMRIPFEAIGKERTLRIEFERGFPLDWIRRLIEDILDFHMLGFGGVFVHGACIIKDDLEVIIPAWRGTGKTNLTLYFLCNKSFGYKAEDQFFLFDDGRSYLYTDACHADYRTICNFESLHRYKSLGFRIQNAIVKTFTPLIPPKGVVFEFMRRALLKAFAPKVFLKMRDFIDMQLSHDQPRQRVVIQMVARPHTDAITVEEVGADRMIPTIVAGMQYERMDLFPFYYAWAFAFGKRNECFDDYVDRATAVLQQSLADVRFYQVSIPRTFNWEENAGVIESMLSR